MDRIKAWWKKIPRHIRRPLVLVVGGLIVLLSGAVGWLPGPGGIPIFLLGIAILASEFTWADRIKQGILDYIHMAAEHAKRRPILAAVIILIGLALSSTIIYLSFFR